MTDYKKIRNEGKEKIKRVKTLNDLKTGTYLPVSIVAYLTGFSASYIRILCFKNHIKSARFPKGCLLVNYESFIEYELDGLL